MISSNNTVLRIVAGKVSEPFSVSIKSQSSVKSVSFAVFDASGNSVSSGVAASADFKASFAAKAWSVESPTLYTLKLKVEYENGEAEELSDRFGFRYLSADDKNIYLNGYPFYMRGYIRGCAAHEHENNCNLSEYEFYKKNILMAKSYGYNTIRFHSVVPCEECFRAADDLGILIHIEIRRQNDNYDNLREMLLGKNDFISDEELYEIINSLYNHPSFMVYCVGNELRFPGKKPRVSEIREIIRREDPTRLFLDTCADGEYDRTTVDFDVQHMSYYFPYGRHADMFSDMDNLLCVPAMREIDMISENQHGSVSRGLKIPRPMIAHEVCHYTSWRDFYALKEKFEKYGRKAPWWVDEEIKMIEAKGYKEGFSDTLQITKNFQFRCWKTALENLRASTLLSGFHMLQFADTDRYENSNGVVDCFDDPHGISPEEFRKFNADTVLLARLPKQIFTSGEAVRIPVLLSQFMINPPKLADFFYEIRQGDGSVREGSLLSIDTGDSGLYNICNINTKIPECESPVKYELICKLKFTDGTACENSWELWGFPKYELPIELNAKCDMTESYLKNTCRFNENASLTVTDKLDSKLFERLEMGEDVMLIYRTDWCRHLLHKDMKAPEYSFRHVWERYKGVIWDRGTINGGPDKAELLKKHGFTTDGEINYQYYHLIEDSDKINLDDFPVKVESLVSGLDKSARDRFDATKFRLPELMYDRTMRNFSYAFSLKVGKGKLLVTGFNFTNAEKGEPATLAMLKTLVSYANSDDFTAGAEISASDLKAYLKKVAKEGPQKEGMMTQYWQLDEEPVESMEYWDESERYLREYPERSIERYKY